MGLPWVTAGTRSPQAGRALLFILSASLCLRAFSSLSECRLLLPPGNIAAPPEPRSHPENFLIRAEGSSSLDSARKIPQEDQLVWEGLDKSACCFLPKPCGLGYEESISLKM